jgi:dienelactone hydrolase
MTRQLELNTVQKTLLTARLIDGFWDRWLAHGVDRDDLQKVRPTLLSVEQWVHGWLELANKKKEKADYLKQQEVFKQAELLYRTVGLYYNLIQWIYPNKSPEKEKWFRECFQIVNKADSISPYQTTYVYLHIAGVLCEGRLTMPNAPKGCVIMINPLDSSKEELFSYEMDFVEAGFITFSFDGPGQGETLALYGLKGTRQRWKEFVKKVIDYASQRFQNAPIYLFGTSSGASWAIYGSGHPKVSKTVAVSPAFRTDLVKLPDYFLERMGAVLCGEGDFLPTLDMFPQTGPVFIFHGKKDVLVPGEIIYGLKERIRNSTLKEYEEEGHCCNFRLKEVRKLAIEWFLEK